MVRSKSSGSVILSGAAFQAEGRISPAAWEACVQKHGTDSDHHGYNLRHGRKRCGFGANPSNPSDNDAGNFNQNCDEEDKAASHTSNTSARPTNGRRASDWHREKWQPSWILSEMGIFRQPARLPDNGDMRNHATPSVTLLLLLLALPCAAQNMDYNNQAQLDERGNIFVSSGDGRLILMADTRHCAAATFADDKQTVGCMVANVADGAPPSTIVQLEIYLKGGKKRTIEPGEPIMDWHFWEEGREIAVHYGRNVRQGTYALDDSATARVIEKISEPTDEKALPQWAKSQAQIDDEAVPTSAALTEERTFWIAKVLRQIEKIEPGMRRKDLGGILTSEGGLSNRFQRTYVHLDCPYIKVNVRFKAVSDESNALKEDPDDTIESVSQPFLQWSHVD